MHKLARRTAVVTVGLGAALGLAVTSASATAQAGWTVTPAGAFEATAANPRLTVPAAELNCDSSSASGTLQASSADGVGIGDIEDIVFTNCNVAGISFTVQVTASPWKLNVDQVNASDPTKIDGSISDIAATISGPGCSASFTGTVFGNYQNGTGNLTIDGTGDELVAGADTSCLGLINPGDVASFEAVYKLATPVEITPA